MEHEVVVERVAARPTAVVRATATWPEFPRLWPGLLGEVWDCLRANDIRSGCRNVMLYLDDLPHVEVGVELTLDCPLTGRVVASNLPAGDVASTIHHGSYSGLADAHRSVVQWCTTHDWQRAGPRWEIYGPHDEDPAKVWTKVCWLLA